MSNPNFSSNLLNSLTGIHTEVFDLNTAPEGYTIAQIGAVNLPSDAPGTMIIHTMSFLGFDHPYSVQLATFEQNGRNWSRFFYNGAWSSWEEAIDSSVVQRDPGGWVNMQGKGLYGVSEPYSAQDAATKNYVDVATADVTVQVPTFLGAATGNEGTSTSPSIVTIPTAPGDLLIAFAGTASESTFILAPTGGTGLVWTLQQSVSGQPNTSNTFLWTTKAVTQETATLAFAMSSGTDPFAAAVQRWNGVAATGASAVNTPGSPAVSLTTTQAHSAIVVGITDYNAVDGSGRAWTPGFEDANYFVDTTYLTLYGGLTHDAGAAGTKTFGLTAPNGQEASAVAIELRGTSGIIDQTARDGLATKANDNGVVHLAGAETITEVKTFSSSPSVPTPTNATDAANKSYVDAKVAAGSGSAKVTSSSTAPASPSIGDVWIELP